MKARKILAIIMTLVLVFGGIVSISGCSKTEEYELKKSEIGGLVAISRQDEVIPGYRYHQAILYDPDTLVMYSMIWYGEGITITVLYNADGTPKLYTPTNIEASE